MNSLIRWTLLTIAVFTVSFALVGGQAVENLASSLPAEANADEGPSLDAVGTDPTMRLLGRSFADLKSLLGEPIEQGYSEWLGPHYYMLFEYQEGYIRFAAPGFGEDGIAASMVLGPGQGVMGVEVGMLFSEIMEILGEPAFSPDLGMDNLFYLGYFLGEKHDQIPEVSITFSATAVDAPTQDVFIKWESFDLSQTEMVHLPR